MRVFLAGGEGNADLMARVKAPYVLCSHYYMRNKSKEVQLDILKMLKDAGCEILMDSGAFTFNIKGGFIRSDWDMAYGWNPQLVKEKQEWEATNDVAEFRKKFDAEFSAFRDVHVDACHEIYAPYCDYIAELDCDHFVDDPDEFRAPLWDIREKIIVTPHLYINDEAEIKRIVTDGWGYLGMEATKTQAQMSKWFNSHMDLFKEHRIKVHGWASTKMDVIRKVPFFSVDSSSWMAGAQYGVTYFYGGAFKMYTHDSSMKEKIRPKLKMDCEKFGIDFDALMADEGAAVNAINAVQWVKYATDEGYNTVNAYWLTEDEEQAMTAKARELQGTLTEALWRPPREIVEHEVRSVPVNQDPRLGYGRWCKDCYVKAKCPFYEAGAQCSVSFRPEFKKPKDFKDFVTRLLEMQGDRVMQAMFMERVQGGYLDKATSDEFDRFTRASQAYMDMLGSGDELQIKAKGSIVKELFGKLLGGDAGPSEEHPVIDITPEKD